MPRRARVTVRDRNLGLVVDPLPNGVPAEVIDLATAPFEARFPGIAERLRLAAEAG